MEITKIICNKNFQIDKVDSRLFGSFLEHMGRVIYSGIYEPDNINSDEDGFRKDVLEQVKQMNVTTIRYPGGNFVSAYHWEDGVGPKEKRPHKIELAWKSIETNEFGTNEFMKWAKKANINPIFTVNLGTRGVEDAVHYLEYCNFPGGTEYSDLRKMHGVDKPYGIKLWCLGNEMDGSWQVGHKSAEEYGKLAAETGKVMKIIDPEIELIVCGSSLSSMETYPEWDMEVLDKAYDIADYLALHQYYAGQEKGTPGFLAQSLDMEEYIHTIRSAAQVIKQKKKSKKDMKFSVDEWGVWAVPSNTVNNELNEEPWQIAPAISEQIYTLEDALLFAEMQMVILRNADAIKIACQSLLTNISACIMTEKGGNHWLQTIYYPFYYFANYAKGIVMKTMSDGPAYSCKEFPKVSYIDSLSVWNKEENELVAKTDYEVTYSTTDFTNVTGTITVTITGIGNYTGKATRTYSITPKTYTVTTESDSKVYDGTALTAGGTVNNLVDGETVNLTMTGSQTDVGTSDNTYELNWTGSAKESNYKHGKDSIGTLTVKAKSIVPDGPDTPDEKKTGITASDPSDSKYDGKEHREVLTVQDTKKNDELVAEKDYSVTYSDDLVNAGTVTITIEGIGNYTGSFTKTYEITKRSVTLTSATASKTYDGQALTSTSITVSGDGFVEGEGATYNVTGTQTEVGNSANSFEYKLNENTLASNYDITKVVGTLTVTRDTTPVTPAPTPTTPSVPPVVQRVVPTPTPVPEEKVEEEQTPKAEPKEEEKVEEDYTPKATQEYYWALINLICAILTVLFGLLLLISKRHKSEDDDDEEDDDEEDDETKQQTTTNEDEEKEQEKKRGLFTRVLAVLIAIVSVVFFLVTEDMSLAWTWTDQWTIWMVVIGLVQIVVFFVGRKWKNVDNDDDDEEAQQA